MPVSKRPRSKKPQKNKKAVPFKKLTGYQVVASTISKTDDILKSVAMVTRALPAIESQFTDEDKANCTTALKHMRLALMDTRDEETGEVGHKGIPSANRRLHDQLKDLSERPHVNDEDFVTLIGEAEWLMNRIAHDLLEPLAALTELVERYGAELDLPAVQDAEHV